MTSALRQRPSTFSPGDGSRTITLLDSQPREEGEAGSSGGDTHEGLPDGYVGTLNLRGGPRSRPRVAWTADVVDNEGMGKKKSKICCIYHKPKRFDESSDESSDSDSSDASDDSRGHAHHHHHHHHRHVHSDGDGDRAMRTRSGDSSGVEEIQDEPKNAYERQPTNKGKQKA